MKWLILAAALALSACQSGRINPAETELLGCDAFTAALITLAGYNAEGKLTDGTVKIVDKTRAYVNPLCMGPAPDVNKTAVDTAIDAGVRVLRTIIAEEN
jgi:hypothetical protein